MQFEHEYAGFDQAFGGGGIDGGHRPTALEAPAKPAMHAPLYETLAARTS
jgi:hypothetical protein